MKNEKEIEWKGSNFENKGGVRRRDNNIEIYGAKGCLKGDIRQGMEKSNGISGEEKVLKNSLSGKRKEKKKKEKKKMHPSAVKSRNLRGGKKRKKPQLLQKTFNGFNFSIEGVGKFCETVFALARAKNMDVDETVMQQIILNNFKCIFDEKTNCPCPYSKERKCPLFKKKNGKNRD